MKITQSALSLVALVELAFAFPSNIDKEIRANPDLSKRADEILKRQNGGTFVQPPEDFNPKQLIDVTGTHAFNPPGPNDLRGPCPGLNAFANHGYLPHNGFATISQFIDATTNVVGMGPQLAAFLAVLGAAIDGDGLGWSIGGTPNTKLIGLDALGITPGDGITGSHNNYEGDASPVRPDLYQEGNNYKVKLDQFQQLIDLQPDEATANYDITVLTKFRSQRFDTQKATNPYFFNGPFTGIAVQPAAYTFIYRFMANHSAAHPEGTLNRDVLASWFAVTGTSGNYSVKDGWERIPANWYRRSFAVPYELEYFIADVIEAGFKYPKFFDVGGNTGTPNSFVGFDIQNLTGGIYNAKDLTDPNKFACYLYQYAAQASPDLILRNNNNLLNLVAPYIQALNCPQLRAADAALLKQYPGYRG